MAFCRYEAKTLEGSKIKGLCWCSSREDLSRSLREKGYFLTKYSIGKTTNFYTFNIGVSSKQLSIFCGQLSDLLSAGINIVEVIRIIKQETSSKPLASSLQYMEEMLYQGMELSYCFCCFDNIFPKFFKSMISVGEESGKLEDTLRTLSKYYLEEDILKNKIIKALIYPCSIFFVGSIVVNIMIFNIIPIFASTLNELGGEMPKLTKLVILSSLFIKNNIILVLMTLLLIMLIVFYCRKHQLGKRQLHKFLSVNFTTEEIVNKLSAVRFSRTLGFLLNSGVAVIRAFEITESTLSNQHIRSQINECINHIKKGSNITTAIRCMNKFPDMLSSMVRVGEETGKLDDMLLNAADIMERELNDSIDKMTALIEPVMILILSVFIGIILIAMLAPMYNIMNII